jgi:hypothetical protein
MNAGYGKSSPKVLNLTREVDELPQQPRMDTKTEGKIQPQINADRFSSGTDRVGLASEAALQGVWPALITDLLITDY